MIILGDNPFFGVNHASAEKSKAYYQNMQKRDWSSALATMRAAQKQGIDHFMVSTHAEAPDLLGAMWSQSELRPFQVIPAVPYLYRLNSLVASRGVPAAALSSMSYPAFLRGLFGSGSVPAAALSAFVAREVAEVTDIGFAVPAVALQNIFVDLLLGMGQAQYINQLADALSRNGRKLVAITMNPLLADRLLDPAIIICTHYNVLGYMVQPDLKQFQQWLSTRHRVTWAMGVMASGEAQLDAVMADPSLRQFDAVLIGSSRPASIEQFARAYAA